MTVDASVGDGVGRVVIDRPDVRNALDIETLEALRAALDTLVADGARAVVVTGRGGAFCAGADLATVRRAYEGGPEVVGRMVDELHGVIRQMQAFSAPLVAAVEGPAVGAGMGLALACDLRVVARSSVLIPGYFGIGASPDGGVSSFLTRSLGRARASSLIIRNGRVDAEHAEAWGLADAVVDDGSALDAAVELARSLRNTPPLALARTRVLLDQATTQGLSAQLDAERDGVASLWPTNDFRGGVTAFLERRSAVYRGD